MLLAVSLPTGTKIKLTHALGILLFVTIITMLCKCKLQCSLFFFILILLFVLLIGYHIDHLASALFGFTFSTFVTTPSIS
jgi:hypothetical protein